MPLQVFLALLSCALVCGNPLRELLPRPQQNSPKGGQCEKRTPDTDRPGDRGLFNLALIYFLYSDLWHSIWLLEQKNEIEPMFLSFFSPVGVFLLIAARRPSEYRSMIALAAWWNISHGVVMAIETVEAWIHKVHRNFTDVIVLLVTGVVR